MKIYIGLYLLPVGDIDRANLGQYIGLFLYSSQTLKEDNILVQSQSIRG